MLSESKLDFDRLLSSILNTYFVYKITASLNFARPDNAFSWFLLLFLVLLIVGLKVLRLLELLILSIIVILRLSISILGYIVVLNIGMKRLVFMNFTFFNYLDIVTHLFCLILRKIFIDHIVHIYILILDSTVCSLNIFIVFCFLVLKISSIVLIYVAHINIAIYYFPLFAIIVYNLLFLHLRFIEIRLISIFVSLLLAKSR